MYTLKLLIVVCVFSFAKSDLKLQILHINDFHARFESIDPRFSNRCEVDKTDICIGGFSRLYSLSKKLKPANPNALFLNAGDNYQGTLWYTMFKSNVTGHFFSELPLDAFVPGNHDFDDGISELIPFLKQIEGKYPTIMANVDMSKEPELAKYIKPSIVLERGGIKIGIIGYVTKQYPTMAKTGNLIFTDEAAAVDKEAKLLKSQGINIIIALSHSGVLVDIEVAKKVELLDIIVGGHSHTFMYTGKPPSYDIPFSEYPLIVNQTSGRKVLVVQAAAYSRYMGNLTVTFDESGEVIDYAGNPILLDHCIPNDKQTDSNLQPYKELVDIKGNEVVGHSKVHLKSYSGVCYYEECNIGNFIVDSMVHSYIDTKPDFGWAQASLGILNAGGIRSSIPKGNITYYHVMTVLPFESTTDAVTVKGSTLVDAVEYSLESKYFLQWSGAQLILDPSQPPGSRIVDFKVVCTDCEIAKLEPLNLNKNYRIVINSFLYSGGDGFTMFRRDGVNYTTGIIDSEGFFKFLKRNEPVIVSIEDRVKMRNKLHLPKMQTTIFG